jgi:hypothetical protein
MPTKFTEEQVQEAIAALKCEFPDIWDVLHSCMRDPFADNDEKFARISRAMGSTLKKLPFVAQAADPYQAKQQLRRQVTDVARSEFRRLSANDDQGRVCTPPIKEAP